MKCLELSAKEYKAKIKKQYAEKGFRSLSEDQKLELILFYALPAQEAINCSHSLLTRLGSLSGVLGASYESLLDVPGMTDSAAVFIKLLPQICASYARSRTSGMKLSNYEQVKEFLKAEYCGVEHETVKLICLNSGFDIVNVFVVAGTDPSQVSVDARKVMSEVLNCECSSCILAHNHPCGNCHPSTEDHIITGQIKELLRSVNVMLSDHIVIGNDGMWSVKCKNKI